MLDAEIVSEFWSCEQLIDPAATEAHKDRW